VDMFLSAHRTLLRYGPQLLRLVLNPLSVLEDLGELMPSEAVRGHVLLNIDTLLLNIGILMPSEAVRGQRCFHSPRFLLQGSRCHRSLLPARELGAPPGGGA